MKRFEDIGWVKDSEAVGTWMESYPGKVGERPHAELLDI